MKVVIGDSIGGLLFNSADYKVLAKFRNQEIWLYEVNADGENLFYELVDDSNSWHLACSLRNQGDSLDYDVESSLPVEVITAVSKCEYTKIQVRPMKQEKLKLAKAYASAH